MVIQEDGPINPATGKLDRINFEWVTPRLMTLDEEEEQGPPVPAQHPKGLRLNLIPLLLSSGSCDGFSSGWVSRWAFRGKSLAIRLSPVGMD